MDTQKFLDRFLPAVRESFGSRLWFVGIQGSRARGEHTEESDIDLVVVLDELCPDDITSYRAVLDAIPGNELACGFLSGREELLAWDTADLVQFCSDTQPLLGTLEEVCSRVGSEAIRRAVHTGACGIYHGCVHNMLYEQSPEVLASLLKSVTFTMRAEVLLRTGVFPKTLAHLKSQASKDELVLLDWFEAVRAGEPVPFEEASGALLRWSGSQVRRFPDA